MYWYIGLENANALDNKITKQWHLWVSDQLAALVDPKGLFASKMEIISYFAHSHFITILYDFSYRALKKILKEC